jgi:hypothetical protein
LKIKGRDGALPHRLRERFTYANVMSTLAVFLFLASGTAYASHLIVRSSDVVNESLRGIDIKEGTLGQVRTATVGGLGRSAADTFCNPPQTNSYVRCVEVSLNLPSPARVLLNGRITTQRDPASAQPAVAQCRWGGVVESGPIIFTTDNAGRDMPLVGLTNVIPAGQGYTFAIECDNAGGNVDYFDSWITAVAISPS